ncbi:MAG TPA: two-component regulator propeller domain-containing protein [Bacteroidia bacterium]|nr:two-component regulator propeller domain-containing protein [Bacteroidia bacterium]
MSRTIKISLLILYCSGWMHAQYQVRNFFNLTGKKDVPVNVITQDQNGYLWLGTYEGVYRFDGISSENPYKHIKALQGEVSALFVDSKNMIWIGLRNGKVYRCRGDQVDTMRLGKVPNTSKITSFCELRNKVIISTYGNGIYLTEKDSMMRFGIEQGLSDNVVYKCVSDKQNRIWCASDAGITEMKFSGKGITWKVISNKMGLPDNIVRDLELNQNELTIAMQDSGVCYYDLEHAIFKRKTFFNEWTLGPVLNVFTYPPGRTIIATESKGLLLVQNSSLHIFNYTNQTQGSSINQAFLDRENQIWLACKKGICHISEKRHQLIGQKEGLMNDKVLALAIDNDQSVWIGSSAGVTKVMKNETGDLVIKDLDDLRKYSITCATKAPDGDIWFGTYGQGIIVLNTKTDNSVIINTKEDRISDNNISHIYFQDGHTLFISTLGGGLIKATVDLEGEYKLFNVDKVYSEGSGLGSNYVYSSVTDSNGVLFTASDGGGLQMLQKNKFIDLDKSKTGSSTAFSLCRDALNQIWAISSEDGILCYNGKTLQKLSLSEGLRDQQPQQIIASGEHVYSIHSKGIDKINIRTKLVTYLDLGAEDLEPNLNAVEQNRNHLYSGTGSGLLVVRIGVMRSDSIAPLVHLKSAKLNYKPFNFDSLSEFRYNQNNFGFGFGGIWLKNPDKLRYRYRLHGFDENWNYSDEGKEVLYNNLDPGNYSFVVQVKNEEDVWSYPSTYSFIIHPPLWKRWWFWPLVLAILGTLIYLVFRYRLRALQKEKMILEIKVKERTAQIEKQTRIIEVKNIELEQLSLVASKTDNVVLILDPEGRLEYINESFVKLHNLDKEQLIHKYGSSIYELSNHPNIRDIVQEAVSNKKSVNYESLNAKTNSEQAVWQSSTLTPIFDNQGELKKIIIIDTDVTERKKQEQIILQKNKDITDSIAYARKIQYSILPPSRLIEQHLPDSFVIYLTKDIVSGDFYWFTHMEEYSIIAAVDCTGHGVPGAFMSLIGYNLLNKIVNEEKTTDPSAILFALNRGVIEALYKNDNESKDGMDIAICKIHHRNKTLEYAGAMRPLWVISNNELREVKADKIPIGTRQTDRDQTICYTTHLFNLKPEHSYYIFTDGYADQFGGPKEKKYSTARFKDLLLKHHNLPFSEQARLIRQEHEDWKGANEQVDDILVIGFRA